MKKINPGNSKAQQLTSSKEDVKQLILTRVNKSVADKFSDDNLDKHNQKETILDMVNKMPYRKFISKQIAVYEKKFRPAYYNELFRLTGLQPNKEKPHLKPRIFAKHTLTIIYRRFPDGIINYLQENNKADSDGLRPYKHFQLLSKLGDAKLLEIIEDAIRIMRLGKTWSHFLRLYAIEFGLTYQLSLFED